MRRLLLALAIIAARRAVAAARPGVPQGFRPESAAAWGRNIWVLGQGNTLLRSTDAGAHFVPVAFPALTTQGNVPVIEFASAQTGYAYGLAATCTPRETAADVAGVGPASTVRLGDGFVYASDEAGLERSPRGRRLEGLPRRTASATSIAAPAPTSGCSAPRGADTTRRRSPSRRPRRPSPHTPARASTTCPGPSSLPAAASSGRFARAG